MSTPKELAYRFDLFIAPEWRARFDALVDESLDLPEEGRLLELNCGTGDYALLLAAGHDKRKVIGIDSAEERIRIARAKALAQKQNRVAFEVADGRDVSFGDGEFAAVIGDASLLPSETIRGLLAEMLRVARPGALVALRFTTKGSFDEFFSILWEALFNAGIVDEVWDSLEKLIEERLVISAAEQIAREAGLRELTSVTRKEEFAFETARQFLESPLIADQFLERWLAIVPAERRPEILERLGGLIERDRGHAPYYVSIKATLISGIK
jgi:ubiquinone/menaquinone biosynthesis C-methylase UbiE